MRRTALIATLLLAGCSSGGSGLLNTRATAPGPDEFGILPNKPLVLPEGQIASLPPPTPGSANLADPTPVADAYAAMGGSAAALNGPVDAGVANYAGRFGVDPGIRGDLRAADAEFRRQNSGRLLERLFGTDTYGRAYDGEAIATYSELDRFRDAGVRTPSAPPERAGSQRIEVPNIQGQQVLGPSIGGGRDIISDR